MATFTEVIESLQTEQENTTKAIESLDNRMLEFISLSKRSMLDDLEDRREAKRQARRGGFFGMGAGSNQTGSRDNKGFSFLELVGGLATARFGLAMLGGLAAALTTGAGVALLATIVGASVAAIGLRDPEEKAKKELEQKPVTVTEEEFVEPFLQTGSIEDAKRLLTRQDIFGDDPTGRVFDMVMGSNLPKSEKVQMLKTIKDAYELLQREQRGTIFNATPGLRSTENISRIPEMEQMLNFMESERRNATYLPGPTPLTRAERAAAARAARDAQEDLNRQRLMRLFGIETDLRNMPNEYNIGDARIAQESDLLGRTPEQIDAERSAIAAQTRASEERQMNIIRRLIGVIGFGKAETRDEIRQRLSTEGYLSDLVPQPPTPTEVQTSTRNVDGLLKAAANYIDRIVRFAAMTSDIIPPDPNDPNYGRLMQDFMLLDEASRRGVPISPLVSPKGQMLEQMGGELGVGGVTIINQTTNNVSSGGGGGGGTAPNTQSSTAAPTNTHNYGISPVDVISAGASR